MNAKPFHTLILGAGPSGLAAGYTLAKAGLRPVIIERERVSGGLMRSIQRGEFIVDIGRKELYNRLAKVDAFWSGILGDDYRSYPHRGGLLYDGHIIDMSPAYQGVRRGMPWRMFLECCFDFLWWRARSRAVRPRNLQEYWYQQRGRRLTQITNQGFQEKLHGRNWMEIPMPADGLNGPGTGFWQTVKQGLVRAFSRKETNTYKGVWRHPARGTGQICEVLEREIAERGGQIYHEAQVLEMACTGDRVTSVTVQRDSKPVVFAPANVVSSASAEFLEQLLFPRRNGSGEERKHARSGPRRIVVLVYLFVDAPPKFPHFWLQVTCQKTRIGRIANYGALNAEMVPKGKACLCCEFYCFMDDPLLNLRDEEFAELALEDCARSKLVDRSKCFDHMVLRFPDADASQNRHNWLSQHRLQLLTKLRQFENLYLVNRTDLDIATLAGIEAAEAILSGDRSQFDRHVDPTQLGIRSESKPFEFRNPPGVEL